MNLINQKFYIVYNVLTYSKSKESSIGSAIDLAGLISLLINSSQVVTVENHISEDKLSSELRVIFWNEDAYNRWAVDNQEKYDNFVNHFSKAKDSDPGFIFERYTSKDNYISKFPYTDYPEKNSLIDWTLITYHKDFMIKNIVPIGRIQDYLGEGKFSGPENFKGGGSRYIKERTSDIVRRPVSPVATKDNNFPRLLAYSFDQAILTCMYTAPWLFRKLNQLTMDAENLANTFIKDCDNAAVLIGHESLGDELTLHTHRLSAEIRYTFTIAVRLTFNGQGAKYKFYEPLNKNDSKLNQYYSNPMFLYDLTKDKEAYSFNIESRTSILTFSASLIPHTVEYDTDLYLFYVYDNVNFREGMLDLIKQKSQINWFEDYPEDSRLYFYSYQ
jgi:hypothetical protein